MSHSERTLIGRIGAVAVLLILLGAFWIGPASAYFGLLDDDESQLAQKQELLARYRALAAAAPLDSSGPASPDMAQLLFPAIPDSQAVALLQEAVKSAAGTAQVQIQGLQVLKADALPGTVRIGIRVRGGGDIAGVSRLLYAIEAARPRLYPDNLQIQSRPSGGRPDAVSLEFQIDVSGFKTGSST